MAKFNFSLQKLLNFRKYHEDERARELSQIQLKLEHENYQLKVLEETKKALFTGNDFMKIDLTSIRSSNEYLIQINAKMKVQKEKIIIVEKEVNEKRAILILANQKKKSVELLKENQVLAFKKEVNRIARINEDEIASRIIQTNGI